MMKLSQSFVDFVRQCNIVFFPFFTVAPKKLNLSTYVLFVLDSSKQVTPVNFRTQKEFVKSMMSRLNLYPGESDSRVGLMVYSEEATVLLNIDNRESKSALERMVDNLPHLKKGRRIDRALEAATNVLKDVGTDNPKFVILVTAGRQEPDAKSFAAAVKPLHQTGTKTHIFAVGGDVDPSYFQGGDKAKTKIFSVPSFTDLPQKTAMLTEDLLKEYGTWISVVITTYEGACVICNYNLFQPKIRIRILLFINRTSFSGSIPLIFFYLVSANS